MHHPTDRIAHTTAFITLVVEHWLEILNGNRILLKSITSRSIKTISIILSYSNVTTARNASYPTLSWTYLSCRPTVLSCSLCTRAESVCLPSSRRFPVLHQTIIRKEIFYLTTHSTHFIYSYMVWGTIIKERNVVFKSIYGCITNIS